MQEIITLAEMSRRYGADPRFVLLGGGNTSWKNAEILYIKPSGVELAAILPEQFLGMDRQVLQAMFTGTMPTDVVEQENAVKQIMAAAVRPLGAGRASVEAPLHESFSEYAYVVHMHPALVNGMTCGQAGAAGCAALFPDALWIEYVNPGYTLAAVVRARLQEHKQQHGVQPQVVFLQNHGVFVAADTVAEIDVLYAQIMTRLEAHYRQAGISIELEEADVPAMELVRAWAPRLRSLLGDASARQVVRAAGAFKVAGGPLSPDHIVYNKSYACEVPELSPEAIASFTAVHGYQPKLISVPGKAVFAAAPDLRQAGGVLAVGRNSALICQLAAGFGGVHYLDGTQRGFIENWEVESYRHSVGAGKSGGRMQNRVCVVTGAAQGFGLGIAHGLAKNGAIVFLADLNLEGARAAAAELAAEFGTGRVMAVAVNVTDEASVAAMLDEITAVCGGLDLFVANAGVLKADSVKTMSKKDWDFVTDVNYTGYFVCVKHAAQVLAKQHQDGFGPWTDIIQINSKSGLEGSNRNGAYAGSKFGTIGLTQSFAKELVEDGVKVNSICPGNFFDGPLWSDPERGLFVQYLQTGKVPGAKTIAEVKKFYESKVPMNRGCTPADVVSAIMYLVEQQYETGQALPVTGGQVMLS